MVLEFTNMALIETLVMGVGSAIAKGVLKLWLKDEPLLLAAADKTTSILAKHVQDIRQRRAVERQVEQIADRAAESAGR